eukprot:scaffold13685_cov101-Isochrysis_galbana.AAC.4
MFDWYLGTTPKTNLSNCTNTYQVCRFSDQHQPSLAGASLLVLIWFWRVLVLATLETPGEGAHRATGSAAPPQLARG